MSVNETDLELLESHLDDELGVGDLEALRRRLSSDPELSEAMDELRGQREMRQQFFASTDPDEASVQRLIQSVRRSVNREIVWAERSRKLGMVGSLAACIMVGFFVGRVTRTGNGTQPGTPIVYNPPSVSGGLEKAVRMTSVADNTNDKNDQSPMRFDVTPGRVNFGLGGVNPNLIAPPRGQLAGYQVRLVDSDGNLIRQFDSTEQFTKFAAEQTAPASQPSGVTIFRFPGN